MNQTTSIKKASDINVFFWFLFAYFYLYLGPFIYLLYMGELNLKEPQTYEHFKFTLIYTLSYLVSGVIICMQNKIRSNPIKYFHNTSIVDTFKRERHFANKLGTAFGWISVIIIFIYYFAGGYKKILLLGSDTLAWDYRMIGYDDTNRVLTAFFELARRVLMPYSILIKLSLAKYQYSSDKVSLRVFVFAAIVGAIMNLDRGPIFLYLTLMVFYYYFTSNASVFKKISYAAIFLLILGIIGSMVTFLQYNIIDFNFLNIYQSLFGILIDRLLLDSVRMAELFSFGDISLWGNPLYLKYSRLGALLGAQYVGTEFEFSMYVAPVGLFGDVWRNFGMPGAIYIGLLHGFIFKVLSQWLKKSDFVITLPVYFLLFFLILYLFYGGMFSQGPFALLFTILILAWFNKTHKRRSLCYAEISLVKAQ